VRAGGRAGTGRAWHDRAVPLSSVLFVVLAAVVVLVAAGAATGRLDAGWREVGRDTAGDGLPQGRVEPDGLAGVRFTMAMRGYRMDEVDAVLDRLALELADRDATIAELRGEPTRAEQAPAESAAAPAPEDAPWQTSS